MTKFYATVCLPPTAPRKVPEALAAAMAPYDWNLSENGNPAGEWDWWLLGAAEEAPLLVRPECDGDRRLITASTVPRRKAELAALGPLECHGGPRGLLDFTVMRRRAVREHDAMTEAWRELSGQFPPARPLAEFVARHEADPGGYPMDRATREHLAQPLVQEVAQRAVRGDDPHFGMRFLLEDPVTYFTVDHDRARQAITLRAVPGHALLTLDGTWDDDHTEGYPERANAYLEDLDPEAVVAEVLCHT
ncbi:hypothetical protein AB0L59_37975 [Streptomyces sp. NPDC052109]|uniref:hypothetical protein n=1 Tax=Streptomyces sp. NPDC052109 TaxID=3155527 RepID=UPI0034219202